MKIRENVPISELTTMRLGGKAHYVVEVENIADVKSAFDFAEEKSLPAFPLGGGANTIGRDEGFDGVLILDRIKGIEVIEETEDGVLVRACGGEVWDDFVAFCSDRNYSGIEAMSGIPGLVGSAPVQNIGAYGQEIAQVIDHVEAYDRKTHEMVILGRDEMQMGYRTTIFNTGKDAGRYFITAVTVELENREFLRPPFYASLQVYLAQKQGKSLPADHHELPEIEDREYTPNEIREAVLAIRGSKLPDPAKIASAGSFFKNVYLSDEEAEEARAKGLKVYDKPNGGHMINSGYLIQDCGLSGQLLHGMRVNEKAALVLINESAKSYEDLAKARAEIRKAVKAKFGYNLEQEPVEISERVTRTGGTPISRARKEHEMGARGSRQDPRPERQDPRSQRKGSR